MKKDKMSIKAYSSADERVNRSAMYKSLKECPIPESQVLENLGLFLESKHLSRILCMDFIYRKIIDVQGVVMEFGTRWGQNVALFSALRGIYEPFNRHRKIIGFDTFSGFPSISKKDGKSDLMAKGQLVVAPKYERYLSRILELHENANPLPHIKKYEICAGDATKEVSKYLKKSPETIVALAYFDFDLYTPTKKCLKMIRSRLTKGSVVAFDELNDPDSPGETLALLETMGLNNVRLQRFPFASRVSYFVV
ncbi:crotonobetainyl-CoA--carnitine CoA-transferase [Elusimicrobiota bacterium]